MCGIYVDEDNVYENGQVIGYAYECECGDVDMFYKDGTPMEEGS